MSGIPLHGRDDELAAVAGVLDAVAGGERRTLVLRGEAGIGKTRLLAEVRESARARRFVILEGRATELENDVPLVPVIDAIEPHLADLPPTAGAALGDERRARLAAVFPELGPPSAGAGPAHAAERWRLHRAIGDLLAVIGRGRPTALLLDDVHWADPATLELLEHLVRRPPRAALLVVLALRPGDAADRIVAARRATGSAGVVARDLGPARARRGGRPDGRHPRRPAARRSLPGVGGQPALAGGAGRGRSATARCRTASWRRCAPRSTGCPATP